VRRPAAARLVERKNGRAAGNSCGPLCCVVAPEQIICRSTAVAGAGDRRRSGAGGGVTPVSKAGHSASALICWQAAMATAGGRSGRTGVKSRAAGGWRRITVRLPAETIICNMKHYASAARRARCRGSTVSALERLSPYRGIRTRNVGASRRKRRHMSLSGSLRHAAWKAAGVLAPLVFISGRAQAC